jgi:hypothetical protein
MNESPMEYAYRAMSASWGYEWGKLSQTDRHNVAKDFIGADIMGVEYVRRIYIGNLQAYANTLRSK